MTFINYPFLFILGLAIGSFLNVLIDRWSAEESIGGRSRCDHCKKTLSWIDLIPIISWIWLGGKCRYCHKKISAYYPLVEVVTGVSFIFVFEIAELVPSLSRDLIPRNDMVFLLPMLISHFGIVSSLIVIFFADLKYHIIPDQATVGLVLFALPLVLMGQFVSGTAPQMFLSRVIAAGVLFGILYGIGWLSAKLLKQEAMGFGDVKLAGAMGFILGLRSALLALYIGFLLGGVVSMLLILLGQRGMKSKIAFGPFLVLGTVMMMVFESNVLRLVEGFLGSF